MISNRAEIKKFYTKQLANETPASKDKINCWHYGKCELEELVDFILEENKPNIKKLQDKHYDERHQKMVQITTRTKTINMPNNTKITQTSITGFTENGSEYFLCTTVDKPSKQDLENVYLNKTLKELNVNLG